MIMRMLDDVNKTKFRDIITFFGLSRLTKTPHKKTVGVKGFLSYPTKTELNLYVWAMNKRKIYEFFNHELKIEIPLNARDYADLTKEDSDFISEQIKSNLFSLEGVKENIVLHHILSITDSESLIKNEFANDVYINGDLLIKKGTKISKSFKMFLSDEVELRKIQDQFSEIIQTFSTDIKKDKVLVLSIDPIDYITMSSSRTNWVSCHHPNKGYGFGGVSYMNDASSVIAYIKNSEDIRFDVFDNGVTKEITYPTKEWRQIVLLNPEDKMAVQLREYPHRSNVYSKKLSDLLTELFKNKAEYGEQIFSEVLDFDRSRPSYDESFSFKLRSMIDYRGPYTFYCDISNGGVDEGYVTYSDRTIKCQKISDKYLFGVGFSACYFDKNQTIVENDERISSNFLMLRKNEREVSEDDDE